MVEYDFSTMPDRRGHVLSMHALIGAYSPEGRAWMEQLKQVLETNIELAINFFQNEVQGVSLRKPEGTYVVVPDFENWCKSHDRTLDELRRRGWRSLARRTAVPHSIRHPSGTGAAGKEAGRGAAAAQGLCFVKGVVRMVSTCHYDSPLGGILLAADEIGLTGLWFDGEKYFADHLPSEHTERETPILVEVKRWLDIYFAGKEPDFLPPLHPIGSAFRQSVWEILLQIPYGKTTTYGEIARQLAEKRKLPRMSAQAVGGAVGHNEISIIIPCHRVVGTNGSLTGYAGGIDKKVKLLKLERTDMTGFFVPKKGTAL